MTSPPDRAPLVRIHYLRPPEHEEVFVQELLVDRDEVKVTLARGLSLPEPVQVHGEPVLEEGSDALWFTFPGAWHDIGRFHRADGRFTGIYANVITPCDFGDDGRTWRCTDLFLDVWIGREGGISLLDEDQFRQALRKGWVDPETGRRARLEARRLMEAARDGGWPPAVVQEWDLERARAASIVRAGEPRKGPGPARDGSR